jgi:hypothetical protein
MNVPAQIQTLGVEIAILPDTTHVTLMNRMTTIVPMINDFLDAKVSKE